MGNLRDRIPQWLRDQVASSGARGLVVGLSGGVDSAVVARLCQLAMPAASLGVLLPCHSDPRDEQDARLVADHYDLPTVTVNLEPAYNDIVVTTKTALAALPSGMVADAWAGDDLRARVPLANIKPRLRMTTLYFVANRLNYLVAGTGNRSELTIGYFTKYGDGGVDLLPLGSLLKSEVWALATELDVPAPVITKAPSAGLWLGQTDEAEMGFTYAELEEFLTRGPGAVSPEVLAKIQKLMDASDHKRRLTPIFSPWS